MARTLENSPFVTPDTHGEQQESAVRQQVWERMSGDISVPPRELPPRITPETAMAIEYIQRRHPQQLETSVRSYYEHTLQVWPIGSIPIGTDQPFTVLPVQESFCDGSALYMVNWFSYEKHGFVRGSYEDVIKYRFPDQQSLENTSDEALALRAIVATMSDFQRPEPVALTESQALAALLWPQSTRLLQ